MVDVLPPDARPPRRPGDGWVACRCGQRHWGRYGAAGLLLWRGSVRDGASSPTARPGGGDSTDPGRYDLVLQHRALWSHHGGTWGLPGGAVDPGETAVQGALREAQEEADIAPSGLRVRTSYLLDHGDWSYTTVVAEAVAAVEPRVGDAESVGVAWVEGGAVTGRQLLPAFADALPGLRGLLGRRLVLVVDGANTMGARPDGWWRDRAAASERLRDELAVLGTDGLAAERLGLPGHTWYPDVVLVTEGRARGTVGVAGADGVGGVAVVDAKGSGDDEVVAQAQQHVTDGADVVVVTADRELRQRVEGVGAATAGPRLVPR